MTARCLVPPAGRAADLAARVAATVPVLETDRLILRAPVMTDFPAWADLLMSDTDGFLGGPFTEEEAWTSFCVYAAGWMLHGHGIFAVELRQTGAVAGFVHIGLEWGDGEPELGWLLLPAYRGEGYALEAASAVRDFGTDLLGEARFVSYVAPDNAASNRLAERLDAQRDLHAAAAMGHYGKINVWRHGGAA